MILIWAAVRVLAALMVGGVAVSFIICWWLLKSAAAAGRGAHDFHTGWAGVNAYHPREPLPPGYGAGVAVCGDCRLPLHTTPTGTRSCRTAACPGNHERTT